MVGARALHYPRQTPRLRKRNHGNAFMATTLATAIASATWAFAEWIVRGKSSVLGFCSGAVAGLVVITPACGFVSARGAMIIGVAAGLIPYFACWKIKAWL